MPRNPQPEDDQLSVPSWPDSKEFWRDKRVTVTGGAGFLGSFVVEKLRERGASDIFIPRKQDCEKVTRFSLPGKVI